MACRNCKKFFAHNKFPYCLIICSLSKINSLSARSGRLHRLSMASNSWEDDGNPFLTPCSFLSNTPQELQEFQDNVLDMEGKTF